MQIYRSWVFIVLLLGATAMLYGQFLWNPIVFDDLQFFMVDKAGKPPISDFQFSWFSLRSLPYATIAWTANLLGLDLINFRVEGLLLHAAVGVALFFFVLQVYRQVLANGANDGQKLPVIWLAFFAALLFVLHPVAVYGAAYLIQRTIVMATLFSLLAMLAYVYGSIRHQPLWLWASVPLYYLAVFSKEHAIMLPAVLLALTMLLHDDWRARLKQRWAIFAAFAAIALFVLLAKKGMFGSVYEINAPEMLEKIDGGAHSYPLSILTQSALFFKYLALWLLPNPAWMSVDMREPFADSLLSPYWFALLGFVGYGVLAVKLLLKRGKAGLIGFALLFPWLFFMTEFSTVRIQESFVLYRSYLWAVGAFCLLPVVCDRVNVRMATLILLIIALAMLPISMERLMTFSHPVLLWDDAEKLVRGRGDLPGAYRIYYNRGTELNKIGQPDQAIADLKQAIVLNKNFVEAHGNLGAAYFKKEDWQNAAVSFSEAIEISQKAGVPPHIRYIYGRAQAFEKMGDMQKAQTDYKESCRLGNKGCDKLSEGNVSSGTPR